MSDDSHAPDPRPPVWVGHVVIQATDIAEANAYWVKIGMRPIVDGEGFAVLELRGGTHLVLTKSGEPVAADTPCPFDIMVEDVDAAHAGYGEAGLEPGEISRGNIHDSFQLRDPSGYLVTVNSSHVSDLPV